MTEQEQQILEAKVDVLSRKVEELTVKLMARPRDEQASPIALAYENEPLRFVGVGQVTAAAAASLGWKEKVVVSTGIADYEMGRVNGTSQSAQCLYPLASAQGLFVAYQTDYDMRYAWVPNGNFKVYLTQNGGSNGNKTTDITYTYDCYIDAAKTIKVGSTLAPTWRAIKKVPVGAATVGLGCYAGTASTATFVLEIAYEEITTNACA
jgi:hypothetical protein